MNEWWGEPLRRRVSHRAVVLFAGLALVLSAVVSTGVMSYSVGQRTREIGVRYGLGLAGGTFWDRVATGDGPGGHRRGDWFDRGVRATRVIGSLLFDVGTKIQRRCRLLPRSHSSLATCRPAATKVDPMVALRYE